MNINKNNYEAFFLDYHEGNLSPHQVADLLLFVEQHPELKEEFESFENIVLHEISEIKFENKNNLKRDISDNLLISSVEGLLTKEENVLLNQQLSTDATLQHEFLLYQKTKLTVDNTLIFENKNDLKRREKKVIPIYYYVAAAASLLLLVGLFFMFNNAGGDLKLANKKIENLPAEALAKVGQKLKAESIVNAQSLTAENTKTEKNLVKLSVLSGLVVGKDKVKNGKLKINRYDNKENDGQQVTSSSQQLTTNDQLPIAIGTTTNNEQPSQVEKETIADIATPIKEKIIDKAIQNTEKKNNGFKKLTGWDFAQLAAKKFNKLTGRKVEVKPTYNDEGNITAYSLTAGDFQITRAK